MFLPLDLDNVAKAAEIFLNGKKTDLTSSGRFTNQLEDSGRRSIMFVFLTEHS